MLYCSECLFYRLCCWTSSDSHTVVKGWSCKYPWIRGYASRITLGWLHALDRSIKKTLLVMALSVFIITVSLYSSHNQFTCSPSVTAGLVHDRVLFPMRTGFVLAGPMLSYTFPTHSDMNCPALIMKCLTFRPCCVFLACLQDPEETYLEKAERLHSLMCAVTDKVSGRVKPVKKIKK